MAQKIASFQNRGMIRDNSISKINNEFAYENFNIRITPNGEDTLLSVTNEKGNEEIKITSETEEEFSIQGTLIGHAVLNSYLILFTTDDNHDYIYRIHYDNSDFTGRTLFKGQLNFSVQNPIETITYYESEDIQKVYWVDGRNQPRMMNFMQDYTQNSSSTLFDFVTTFNSDIFQVSVEREFTSTSSFPSGVIQYVFTYSRKFGQETNIVYTTPLYYSSRQDRGSTAEETVNCQFNITISGIDTSFEYLNIYSILRTSYNSTPQVNKVASIECTSDTITYVDNNTNRVAIDPSILLYIGGREIVAGTLTYKDNTLFLGDLTLKNTTINTAIKDSITKYLKEGNLTIEFTAKKFNISAAEGLYPYSSQLKYSSQQIKGFKGGEYYRLGIRFRTNTGEISPVYYLKTIKNPKYPSINTNGEITYYYPKVTLPSEFVEDLSLLGYASAQVMIEEATDSDRVIAAQGVVCPTLFNLKQRCSNSPFSISSWFTRVEDSDFTIENLEPLGIGTIYSDEIQSMSKKNATPYYLAGDTEQIEASYKALALLVRNSGNGGKYGSFGLVYIDLDKDKKPIAEYANYSSHILYEYPTSWVANKWANNILNKVCSEIRDIAVGYGWNLGTDQIKDSLMRAYICQPEDDPSMCNAGIGDERIYIVSPSSGEVSPDTRVVHTVNGDSEKSDYDLSWSTNALACIQTLEVLVKETSTQLYHIVTDSSSTTLKNNHLKKYGNYYFLDKNIVTFHTPELTEYNSNNFDNSQLSFRIVGIAPITALIANHSMNVSQGYLSSSEASGESPNMNIPNIDREDKNYFYYPLYIDAISQGGSITDANVGNYFIYPWHKEGSIIGASNPDTGVKYSELNHHTTGRLWYSYGTSFFETLDLTHNPIAGVNSSSSSWEAQKLSGIRVWDSEDPTLLQISTAYGNKLYQATYDYMITLTADSNESYDTGYPIYYVDASEYSPDVKDLPTGLYPKDSIKETEDTAKKFYDPVRIQYKSPRHIVLALGTRVGSNSTRIIEGIPTLTPIIPISEALKNSYISITSVLPWVEDQEAPPIGDTLSVLYPKQSNTEDALPASIMFSDIRVEDAKVQVMCTQPDARAINTQIISTPVKPIARNSNSEVLQRASYRSGVVISAIDDRGHYQFTQVSAPLNLLESAYPAPYHLGANVSINTDKIDIGFQVQIIKYIIPNSFKYPTVTVTTDIEGVSDIKINQVTGTLEDIEVPENGILNISFTGTKFTEVQDKTITITCNGMPEYSYTTSSMTYTIHHIPEERQDTWEGIEEISISELMSSGIIDTEYICKGVLKEDSDSESYYKFKDTSTEDYILIDKSTIGFEVVVDNTYTIKGQLKELEEGKRYLINALDDSERYTVIVMESFTITPKGNSISNESISENTARWHEFTSVGNTVYNDTNYILQKYGETSLDIIYYTKGDGNVSDSFVIKSVATETTLESVSLDIPDSKCSVFIGELYDKAKEEAYKNETSLSDFELQQMTFIPSGKFVSFTTGRSAIELHAEEGDTYFQRWDSVRTLPLGEEDTNSVVDICSFMVETHQNLDGRCDNRRGNLDIVNTTSENFNLFNEVYNQSNNFFSGQVLDDKYSLSRFPSQITWSKTKTPTEEVDTWTNITLASTLGMDGDKGPVRALRRFHNSIVSFQDKGIAEILFNSRTQMATVEGVPIELANSGKVDGKRYISDKDGCLNKWSIVETSNGIYFIDDLNTSLNFFNGQIASLSSAKGFKNWVADHSSTNIWNPVSFANTISFWDRASDDVYFVTRRGDKANVLCYNEFLQQFTSFYSYGNVPMMINLQDKFIAYRDKKLWDQGKIDYCNLFEEEQDFYMQYRIAPDPYSDKVFTNIEYKADTFDSDNNLTNNTFDFLKVWNEYQDTGDVEIGKNMGIRDYPSVRRKFRVWRMDIPRDSITSPDNKFGLNRIRNPWIHLKLTKKYIDERMVFHDLAVRYL